MIQAVPCCLSVPLGQAEFTPAGAKAGPLTCSALVSFPLLILPSSVAVKTHLDKAPLINKAFNWGLAYSFTS